MNELMRLLGALRDQGVVLEANGDILKCSAPPGTLTPVLRAQISENKAAILDFIRSSKAASAASQPELVPVSRAGSLPLSYAQQRLWFFSQLDPQSRVYNIPAALRMTGRLDVVALESSFIELIRRHESLRTSFTQVRGIPQCVIHEKLNWSLNVIDARHLGKPDLSDELMGLVVNLTREAFDLTSAPLFRAHLLITGEQSHILVLVLHHIITDGWSMDLMIREIAELYRTSASGIQPSQAALPLQYVDFAIWQRAWLDSGERDRQLAYWKHQLQGAPAIVTFPPDCHKRSANLFRGKRAKFTISKALLDSLQALSRRRSVTLYMTMLAAFNVLLSRWSGQEDVVVGTPSANRSRRELYPILGFFVNNLVLRTDLSGNPTFDELLNRMRETALRAYEQQDLPFDQLVQALHPGRSLDHFPLFQVMFILQNFASERVTLHGLAIEPIELPVETARYDLTVEVFPRSGELDVFFDYNCDLYDPKTISRLQLQYQTILETVVVDSSTRIRDLVQLTDAEKKMLLVEWNATEAEIPETICFHHIFERQAAATPDRVAALAGDDTATYGELNARANQIAANLRQLGAGPNKLVAIFEQRGIDLLAAILGVAKSGAAYVPLDPSYPKHRIKNILDDAEPVAILTRTLLANALPPSSASVLCLDSLSKEISAGDPQEHPPEPTQGDLAYVIFTSGSTGRPKGVEISHRSLLNLLESMRKQPGMTSEDVLLAVTTVSFDIAALELLLPLITGARVCVALKPADPASLLADLERYRPTVMQATPATWKLLIAAGWKGDSSLRILCGGEAMDPVLAQSLLIRCSDLWNMYGPTETTIWSALYHVNQADLESIPLGRPIQNTSFYVLDAEGRLLPPGVVGELWIAGVGVARGYLKRLDLTEERFRICPWIAPGNDARMYRTGDLVRFRPDGILEFHGRTDHQIKLRGFRIEPGEMENALRRCDGVGDAVVVLRDDTGEKQLVAYVTARDGSLPDLSNLRIQLREILPEYMLPSAVVVLDRFPRLPNGKLDRSALPNRERPADSPTQHASAQDGTLERLVAQVLANVLGVESVAADENFFDLGAHSLQMVQVQAELNSRIDFQVSLVSLFEYPNVRALSDFIERSGGKAKQEVAVERS
jgi:amino acid adenylation domain-containing protein